MDKSIDALFRLARFKVETLQKSMAALDRARAEIDAAREELDHQAKVEAEAAAIFDDALFAYGDYLAAVQDQKSAKTRDMDALEGQRTQMKSELATAFEEMKKIEHLSELRAQRLAAERARRESAQLDEMTTIRAAG